MIGPSLCRPKVNAASFILNGKNGLRIAVVGGGIAGLSAAHTLKDKNLEVSLFESSDRLGGIIQTTTDGEFLFEHAADSFIVSPELPWGGELCEQLELELEETSKSHRGAHIVKDGELFPVPSGLQLMLIHDIGAILRSPLLSWQGKARVLAERFIPKAKAGVEESLHQFAVRRFGKEMVDRIIQPLVAGIYTADPERLSMNAALRQFVAQEQEFGSLHGAAKARRDRLGAKDAQGARYGLFRSPRRSSISSGGMQSLIDALERSLDAIRIHKQAPVSRVTRCQGHSGYEVHWQSLPDESESHEEFDAVILATPVRHLPRVVQGVSSRIAEVANAIECVSTAVIGIGLPLENIEKPLETFGVVVPHVEGRRSLAMSFTSVKFPDRAPAGHALLRVFVGGALQPEVMELSDAELVELAMNELRDLVGASGKPVAQHVFRWVTTTPQYNLGHRGRVSEIRRTEAEMPGLAIAGNAYSGVGIPQCIKSGRDAAEKVLTDLLYDGSAS